jgi:hypothetical protein
MALDWQLAILVAVIGSYWAVLRRVNSTHDHLVEHFDRRTYQLEGIINLSTQDTVNAVVAQLGKAKAEVIAKLAEVQAQLDAVGVTPEAVDLSALVAAAEALDAIVPDVVAEIPADEPAVEVPVEVPSEEPAV